MRAVFIVMVVMLVMLLLFVQISPTSSLDPVAVHIVRTDTIAASGDEFNTIQSKRSIAHVTGSSHHVTGSSQETSLAGSACVEPKCFKDQIVEDRKDKINEMVEEMEKWLPSSERVKYFVNQHTIPSAKLFVHVLKANNIANKSHKIDFEDFYIKHSDTLDSIDPSKSKCIEHINTIHERCKLVFQLNDEQSIIYNDDLESHIYKCQNIYKWLSRKAKKSMFMDSIQTKTSKKKISKSSVKKNDFNSDGVLDMTESMYMILRTIDPYNDD